MNIHYTDHNGRGAWIMATEVDAIERTGRSNWIDYASFPDSVTHDPGIMAKIEQMGDRPGAVTPGTRPAQRFKITATKGFALERFLRTVQHLNNITISAVIGRSQCTVWKYRRIYGIPAKERGRNVDSRDSLEWAKQQWQLMNA